MAVSDSTDFNLDAAEVIQDAYERCGIQEVSGKDLRSAVRSMNLLMAEWANRGLNLWTVTLGTQSTSASDNDYALGTNVVDLLEVVLRDSNNIDALINLANYYSNQKENDKSINLLDSLKESDKQSILRALGDKTLTLTCLTCTGHACACSKLLSNAKQPRISLGLLLVRLQYGGDGRIRTAE